MARGPTGRAPGELRAPRALLVNGDGAEREKENLGGRRSAREAAEIEGKARRERVSELMHQQRELFLSPATAIKRALFGNTGRSGPRCGQFTAGNPDQES